MEKGIQERKNMWGLPPGKKPEKLKVSLKGKLHRVSLMTENGIVEILQSLSVGLRGCHKKAYNRGRVAFGCLPYERDQQPDDNSRISQRAVVFLLLTFKTIS